MEAENSAFLGRFDSSYFRFLAELYAEAFESEPTSQTIAVAIRTSYGHALETLFALTCSVIQAPHCVVGWLQKYRNRDLREVVREISQEREILSTLPLHHITWQSFSELLYMGVTKPKGMQERLVAETADFLGRAAAEVLDERAGREYNSLKHGMRIEPGGFSMSITARTQVDEPNAAEHTINLQGSDFGSRTLAVQRVHRSDKSNLRLVQVARNWNPEALLQRLRLASHLIHNIVAFMRRTGPNPASEVEMLWLDSAEAYQSAWEESAAVLGGTLDLGLAPNGERLVTGDHVLDWYHRQREKIVSGRQGSESDSE
ncbi:MAG: hypothetical protein ACQEXJ_12510 [Myxococcota bacterium]